MAIVMYAVQLHPRAVKDILSPRCCCSRRGQPLRPLAAQASPGSSDRKTGELPAWVHKYGQDISRAPARLTSFLKATAQTASRLHKPTLRQSLSAAVALLAVCCMFMAAVLFSQQQCLSFYRKVSGSRFMRTALQTV